MVYVGINKTPFIFQFGQHRIYYYLLSRLEQHWLIFFLFSFHSPIVMMEPCQTINSAVPDLLLGFFYTDINSEGNFSFNFCSCLVILASQSLVSHLILSQGLGSVMPVKTCQLSNHSSSQPRSRKNVCSWMLLLPQIVFVSCFTKLSLCNALRLWCSVITPVRLS